MTNPLFSIIVPCYKPQYLRECIESILGQTYSDFELILVNDGSPYPEVEEIIKSFSDPRVHYFKREKGFGAERLVDNWNDCLMHVSGEYVINMGDDDALLPNCLEDYKELITKYPDLNVYHMRTMFIDCQSKVTHIQQACPDRESVWSMMWHTLTQGRQTMMGDYLISSSWLKQNGGYYYLPYAWHSDRITPYLAAKEKGIASTYRPGFLFRDSGINISSDSSLAKVKIGIWDKVLEWYEGFMKEEPTDELDKYLYRELKAYIPEFILRSRIGEMVVDVKDHHSHIMYWAKNRRKWGFSMSNIANLAMGEILIPSILRIRKKLLGH